MIQRTLGMLCFVMLAHCALVPPKDLGINPKIGDRNVKIQRSWDLMTRKGYFKYEGNSPQELGGLSLMGDALIFGNLEGRLMAVDRFSGVVLWSAQLPDAIESKPLIHDRFIYISSSDGGMYGLSVHGGRVLWKVNLDGEALGEPTVSGGMLLVHTVTGRIISLDAETGKWMWEVKRPLVRDKSIRSVSKPVVNGDRVYVGTVDGYLLVLNIHDGTKIWEKSITTGSRFTDIDNTPIISGKMVIISALDGKTYGLRMEDGGVLWAHDQGAVFSSILVESTLFLPTQKNSVQALDSKSGKLLWEAAFDSRDGMATGVSVENGLVAFGTTQGGAYVVSAADGHFVWTFRPGAGSTSTPIIKSDQLYLYSNYGNVYAFGIQ